MQMASNWYYSSLYIIFYTISIVAVLLVGASHTSGTEPGTGMSLLLCHNSRENHTGIVLCYVTHTHTEHALYLSSPGAHTSGWCGALRFTLQGREFCTTFDAFAVLFPQNEIMAMRLVVCFYSENYIYSSENPQNCCNQNCSF